MRTERSLIAACPTRFGRARAFDLPASAGEPRSLSDDLQLFAATFLGGFVFVSVLIG